MSLLFLHILDFFLNFVPLVEDQQALEEEGLLVPATKPTILQSYRNPSVVLPNFSAMGNAYHNIFHPAINSSLPLFPFGSSVYEGVQQRNFEAKADLAIGGMRQAVNTDGDRNQMEMTTFPAIVYQTKLSKLNVGGVVDILHQVDELRPCLEQIIPKLKDNGISGKVLRHCDLKELKNVRWKHSS